MTTKPNSTESEKNSGNAIRLKAVGLATVALIILGVTCCRDARPPAPPKVPPSSPIPLTQRAEAPKALPSEKPAAPKSPGLAQVSTRMKELNALGCTNVLHPPVGVKGTTAWTPTFPPEKDANCLVVISATGNPDKGLTLSIRLPSGDIVETTKPVPLMDYVYCAKNPGPHPVNVVSPTNERYTFAAMDCPRKIAGEILKKQSSK